MSDVTLSAGVNGDELDERAEGLDAGGVYKITVTSPGGGKAVANRVADRAGVVHFPDGPATTPGKYKVSIGRETGKALASTSVEV